MAAGAGLWLELILRSRGVAWAAASSIVVVVVVEVVVDVVVDGEWHRPDS
jgi:hypothetical protein